jgi:hypothetical protein
MRIGRVIGLARPIDERMVGLANGNVPLCEIGDDATDPAAEDVIGTGIGPRDEEPERGIYIGERDVWFSRKNETEGETARRFEEVGYGSKRSSSRSRGRSVSSGEETNETRAYIFVYLCAQLRMMLGAVYISIDEVRVRRVSQIEMGAAVAWS